MLIARWTGGLILVRAQDLSMEQWWNSSTFVQPRKERKRVAVVLMYTAWNLKYACALQRDVKKVINL
jgi:hypothetical protein